MTSPLTSPSGAIIIFLLGMAFGPIEVFGNPLPPARPAATCAPATSGLAAWYPAQNNTNDAVAGNNGTLQGGATYADGFVGRAFIFNGTTAYVEAPSTPANQPTAAGTQDAWVFFHQTPSAAGHHMEIIGAGGLNTDFDLVAFSDDKFYFYIAAGTHVASTTVVQTGVWYHVAGTWDSTGLRIYVNGVLENTTAVSNLTRGANNLPIQIGGSATFGGRLFNGLIDEAHIFDRALSALEVEDIFNTDDGGFCPSSSPTPTPSQLLNIATRLRVQTGENVLIGGFIITGPDPKKVIIRGIGPSLSTFFSGVLANPTLELFQGNTLLQSNDDWKTDQQAEIAATGIPPNNDLESAIVRTVAPGSYTAVLRGSGNTSGIGVVEAYDLDQTANSKLANIATRGFVETNDNVMIGGLIVGPSGGTSIRVVVRAIGPSLTGFGIAGAVQDPTLDLVNSSGTIVRSNDDWKDSQQAEITATGLQPADDRESAMEQTVAPGAYTAIVRGKLNTTGVGLVEVYNLP